MAAAEVCFIFLRMFFTAYLEAFDTNRDQAMENIKETQASVVALLEQTSRVENCSFNHCS